ncbi:MAG: MFS transporter [Rhodospirillales bacterium]|nr:MFS transporter [Rhodospirillales bacterium]
MVILICGTAILMIAMGVRMSYGLWLVPASRDLGWGLEELSFAMALQALFWGLGTPVAGAVSDRYGAGRVLVFAGLSFTAGLILMTYSTTPLEATLSIGILTGLGMSACTFPIILSVISRAVPDPKKRSLYLGIASAAGSSGQFVLLPTSQIVLQGYGWITTLIFLAAVTALIVPLAGALAGGNKTQAGPANIAKQSLGAAVLEAGGHRGYVLLISGYFVCGFQTLFIVSHFPALVDAKGISMDIGAWAISLIGLFNIFGCLMWGALSARTRKKYLLSWLYGLRSIVMAVFILTPVTDTSVLVFAAAIGMLWLGTVQLTGALISDIFGMKFMGTLFGFAFVSHQLGSFIGVWAGGRLFDIYGNYDFIWWSAIALGVIAAGLHFPIDDRPVVRNPVPAAA